MPRLGALVLLFAPAGLLAIAAARSEGVARSVSIGVGVTMAVEGLFILSGPASL